MSDNPSPVLVDQRIRNRIIEYLGAASSYDEQRDYALRVPIVSVPNEMINEWEDWAGVDAKNLLSFDKRVFSSAELEALQAYHAIWLTVVRDTPRKMPALREMFGTEPWDRLRSGASAALSVLMQRGKFSEEQEEF